MTPEGKTWSRLVADTWTGKPSAFLTSGAPTSGDELLHRAAGLQSWLLDLIPGPVRGVPALLSDSALGMTLLLAGAAASRPLAPLGTRLSVAELTACVRELNCPVLIAEPAHVELAHAVAWAAGVALATPPEPLPTAAPGRPPSDPDAIVYWLHTSGTTGAPKPVAYREGPLAGRVRVYTTLVPLAPGDVFVSAAGLHHIAGSGNLAVALAAGATIVSFPAFSVAAWRALWSAGVTHALLIPSMIEMLLAADALALPNLRSLQYGGSPIHPETLQTLVEQLPAVDLWQLFGQTEGSPLCALSPADHQAALTSRPELLRSVGRAAPEVEIRLLEAGDDGVGELSVRGPHLFGAGPDGWMPTGDLGRIDEGGYVFLAGRQGDTINRGGENVRPAEIEAILRTHPAVVDAAVVGVPERRLGEEVAAFVIPADLAAPPPEAELTAHVRKKLAGYKVPRHWRFVAEFPRNSQGKLLRRELRLLSTPEHPGGSHAR